MEERCLFHGARWFKTDLGVCAWVGRNLSNIKFLYTTHNPTFIVFDMLLVKAVLYDNLGSDSMAVTAYAIFGHFCM
jgi:hypothetical protein